MVSAFLALYLMEYESLLRLWPILKQKHELMEARELGRPANLLASRLLPRRCQVASKTQIAKFK